MSAALNHLIVKIIKDQNLHARWINTFSYLEYIGFRKIVKSQEASAMSAETLTHAVEEGRHALRLKKLAVKTGGAHFDQYLPHTLLCPKDAESYFQSLDKACEQEFSSLEKSSCARLTYLYVTWLIEMRALDVYKTYQAALPKGEEFVLTALLAEEEKHLEAVMSELQKRDPSFITRREKLHRFESALYHQYLQALRIEITATSTLSTHAAHIV